MAVPQRIPVRFEDVFPQGAYVLSVDPVNDYEKAQAGVADPQGTRKPVSGRGTRCVAERCDGSTGRYGSWTPTRRLVPPMKVKIATSVRPVPPEPLVGTPFRPVEFERLIVTPYVDTNRVRPRQAFSLRAAGMRPVQVTRRPVADKPAA